MAAISKPAKLDEVRQALEQLDSESHSADQLMQGITLLLHERMLKYNWVGFYMLDSRLIRRCWFSDTSREP